MRAAIMYTTSLAVDTIITGGFVFAFTPPGYGMGRVLKGDGLMAYWHLHDRGGRIVSSLVLG